MLNLLRVGSILAVVLTLVSANLWRELRSERQLTAELRTQLGESMARTAAPAAPAQRTVMQEGSAAPEPEARRAVQEVPPPSASVMPPPVDPPPPIVRGERDLMKDPEYRKARISQARMTLKRVYTDLQEELGMSDAEVERLYDILAEQQAGGTTNSQQALRDLLGPGRQAKWQEYQQTLSARSRASSMTAMLAQSGHPLTEAQLRPLTTALIAEEKYLRQNPSALSIPGGLTPEARAMLQEEQVNRQEESNRRYLEAAAPYMTPQQLALVRETLENQVAISRASARQLRQRLESTR